MPNLASELSRVQANFSEQGATQRLESVESPKAAIVDKLHKLPYQASLQAELLHLQADIDALLQQLQTLQQQRLTHPNLELEAQHSEIPVLV